MTKNYTIDEAAGTLTYIADPDTQERETLQLGDVVELLAWLKHREPDLRRIVFMAAPVDVRKPLRLVNGFYVGCCGDRRLVKIRAEALENMLHMVEQRVRTNWLFDRKEEAQYRAGPVLIEQIDKDGKPMYAPIDDVTEQDTPDHLIQPELYRVRQVEFWVDRPENLSLGRYSKTL